MYSFSNNLGFGFYLDCSSLGFDSGSGSGSDFSPDLVSSFCWSAPGGGVAFLYNSVVISFTIAFNASSFVLILSTS